MTTKDAIKMLPLDDKLKIQLLNMYDYMEPDQKLTVEVLAWRSYFLLQDEKLQANIVKELDEVEKGAGKLGPAFYSDVLKKTDQQELQEKVTTATNVDLAAARRAMEQIINEIHASKKKPARTKH